MTSTDATCTFLYWILAVVLGQVVKLVSDWLIREIEEGILWRQPGPLAPRTKRRLVMFGVTPLVPSIVYVAYSLLLSCEAYQLDSHVTFVLAAFGVSQWRHGETKLAKVPTVEVTVDPPHEIRESP